MHALGAAEAPPWALMAMPSAWIAWAMAGAYCLCILLGQLLLAKGSQHGQGLGEVAAEEEGPVPLRR